MPDIDVTELEPELASDRLRAVRDVTMHIRFLCSGGKKERVFDHFMDVIWPNLHQFISEENANAMARVLAVRRKELEIEQVEEEEKEGEE